MEHPATSLASGCGDPPPLGRAGRTRYTVDPGGTIAGGERGRLSVCMLCVYNISPPPPLTFRNFSGGEGGGHVAGGGGGR